MQFDQVLRTFTEFFEREGIQYALIGGLAIHALGHSRSTDDIDFAVALATQHEVIAFAQEQGYETIHASDGFSNHVSKKARVDFMYLDADTATRVFASVSLRPMIGGISAPVPRPEYLVAMKVLAMKNNPRRAYQEMNDILFLTQLPGVDRNEVREYFSKYGLLPLFDELERKL